jgi:hypothetical protein
LLADSKRLVSDFLATLPVSRCSLSATQFQASHGSATFDGCSGFGCCFGCACGSGESEDENSGEYQESAEYDESDPFGVRFNIGCNTTYGGDSEERQDTIQGAIACG